VILVDTSVWIDHLHRGVPESVARLEAGEAPAYPLVTGELACGNIRNRAELLSSLTALPGTVVATHDEVLALIDRQSLMGRGLGFIDAHLLASAPLTPESRHWTRYRRLRTVAEFLELAYAEHRRTR
jgi:predicted nucleic acid-binding protein